MSSETNETHSYVVWDNIEFGELKQVVHTVTTVFSTTDTGCNYNRRSDFNTAQLCLIKSRLKSGTACCHSVQNLLSSSLLSENVQIKLYRTRILPVVVYGCKPWSVTLKEAESVRE
jgi:hypothetical protein